MAKDYALVVRKHLDRDSLGALLVALVLWGGYSTGRASTVARPTIGPKDPRVQQAAMNRATAAIPGVEVLFQ
jgi:hypothetical protein